MRIRFLSKAILLFGLLCFSSCTKTFEGQNPVGQRFPSVNAEVLDGETVALPEFFDGKRVLLLVGFIQDSQFDIDRWVLALKQLGIEIELAEIPAIQGWFPRLISNKINSGMREGIPEEEWGIVFTVYDDAVKIAEFLGNTTPRNARVVLLDSNGKVSWFYDRGYSAERALELHTLLGAS
ncbi:MAG: hypothetical protein KDD62_08515 [Bdellovibrionales bacterium]|nr:hypothetical protein [Bdellovibrionales bacterium]